MVTERETDDERRGLLRLKLQRAESLLEGFVEDQGGLPSEVGRVERGAIGKPWEDVAREGM
jgi:hypothetical protein